MFTKENVMLLPDLKGKELEALVKERASEYLSMRLADITAAGVQAVMTGTAPTGEPLWQIIQSLPDFEGVTSFGAQFIFDCKVCSQSSFDLSKYNKEVKGPKSRQLRHMQKRARFNVPCFFLMHWNSRSGKTFSEPAETYLFPVEDSEFWDAFERAEKRSITRKDCREYGVVCKWSIYGNGRKPRPEIIQPVLARIETGVWKLKEAELFTE
jgi:penicillin-binding protein-related factor A (putative recombinase)